MPFKLNENHRECPARRPWAVVKKGSGEVMGCHSSEDKAKAQMSALYANEPEASSARADVSQEDLDEANLDVTDAGELNAAARRVAAARGWAMDDGSFPIRPADMHGAADLDKAINAVGRSNKSHDAVRRHIMRRAEAIGESDQIPETWNEDGSLAEESSQPPQVVTRAVPFTVEAADEDGDGLTLTGYAAVFNSPTRIDSFFEGTFDEVIAPGAFKRTLSARTPVLQFDHGMHPVIGGMPLGRYDRIREDEHGLYVEARLSDNWMIQPVRDAIRDGAVTGMSFRFSVPSGKDEWHDRDGDVPLRTVREVKLFEAGPVVFPAYEDTSVGVRARHFAAELDDPDFRAELARALLTGTSGTGPAAGTPGREPAVHNSDPRHALRGITHDERAGVLRALELESLGGNL